MQTPSTPSYLALFQILLACAAGAGTAFQPGVNSKFGEISGTRLHGTIMNFVGGLALVLLVALLFRTPAPSASKLASGPWWIWTGGALGAFFVTVAIVLVPKIGSANYLAAMIAGQLIASAIIDHFGLMGLARTPISPARIGGLLLIGTGVAVLRFMK
jgi:transporter family-2 protein